MYAWARGIPANAPVCKVIPPNERGVPEQVCCLARHCYQGPKNKS
jgi:hypothetical protein